MQHFECLKKILAKRPELKLRDQAIAIDITGFAGVVSRDGRGNLLSSVWSKAYDDSSVGVLLERNDVRVLLLKQIEAQIRDKKDQIGQLEQDDVLCKWILDFTDAWETAYTTSKAQQFDIGQMVISAMHETYFEVEQFLEHNSPLKPSKIKKRITEVYLKHKNHETRSPDIAKQVKFLPMDCAVVRLLFRNEFIGLSLRRLAGKYLQKQETCNKPGAYSARVQRNDITQLVHGALDQFCKILLDRNDKSLYECMKMVETDEEWLLEIYNLIEGSKQALRSASDPSYLKTGDPGREATTSNYTATGDTPTLEQYESIFGPAGRDVKQDSQRQKRHQRWHLPDALKGYNQFLTDRVDGLITDATNSPFTRTILPYKYLENPDQKLKWNVYSFDEGIASRVPYEAAARVLPQSKKSFAGFTVRHGLAIAMEHNFMMSAAGRENFKNQLTQLVGSIQMTNDLDVHVALLTAPSYQKAMTEKYYDQTKTTSQAARQYTDIFGIMQKTPNALDILIEDAKNHLKTWGSQPPSFMLCNGKLTTQLTMLPEKTNYLTNGPDGLARLAAGPDLPSYRGLNIVHSKKFSLDTGTAPRDLLRRKVRVAEYHYIKWDERNPYKTYEFYDQSRDTMFRLQWSELLQMSTMTTQDDKTITKEQLDFDHIDQSQWKIPTNKRRKTELGTGSAVPLSGLTLENMERLTELQSQLQQLNVKKNNLELEKLSLEVDYRKAEQNNTDKPTAETKIEYDQSLKKINQNNADIDATDEEIKRVENEINIINGGGDSGGRDSGGGGKSGGGGGGASHLARDLFILRPNIEHEMLGIIMGRGGTQELGCTFWGQTELSCYDDAQHGIWGMSYKYHERAMVMNERNLIRVYDVAFDGYNGGMDQKHVVWDDEQRVQEFRQKTFDRVSPYTGPSMLVMNLPTNDKTSKSLPNPLIFTAADSYAVAPPDDSSSTITDLSDHNPFGFGLQGTEETEYFDNDQCKRYKEYFSKLEMNDTWISASHSASTPGEMSMSNNSESRLMAFEGTMRTYEGNILTQETRGSGHLGPSYVGVASVREGRGINNSAMQPTMGRLI